MKKKTMRMFAFLITVALVLCACLPTALAAEDYDVNLNLGSDPTARFVLPIYEDLDSATLTLNGIPYIPVIGENGNIILRTGDFIAALASERAGLENTFIQGGKLRQTDAFGSTFTPILDTINPFSLSGENFTVRDGNDNTLNMNIVNIWQSPLPPPGYDPNSEAPPPVYESRRQHEEPLL